MKRIVLILFLLPTLSFANDKCTLTTFSQIIKINTTQDDSLIKQTNCPETTVSAFISFIESANGKLNSNYLSQYFKNEYQVDIEIQPNSIKISHIKDLITDNLNNPNAVIKQVTSMIPGSSITLGKNQNIKVACNNCDTAGSKNISVEFSNKKYWLNAKLYLKRKSYILTKNVMTLNDRLDQSYFKEKTILDDGTMQFFGNIEKVQFYRLNRYLKEGDVIKRGDLSPRQIIRYGDKVKLKFKDQNIELNSMAIANGPGKFGDFIQVINPRSKKKILAKVIDYNKVEVEL